MTALLLLFLVAGPRFNEREELQFPADYREWTFVSAGLGMTYGPARPDALENPRFENVFVNPEAYRYFKEHGTWPEGTVFVLEIRRSVTKASINQGGFSQGEIAAIEVNVKDSKRFGGNGWGYFEFGGGGGRAPKASTERLGPKATCPACHTTNGAVDSTFVQFYPELLPIAQRKGTVREPKPVQ
jgi:hypothetical protein